MGDRSVHNVRECLHFSGVPGVLNVPKVRHPSVGLEPFFSQDGPEWFFTAERDASGRQAECSPVCLQGQEALYLLFTFFRLFLVEVDHLPFFTIPVFIALSLTKHAGRGEAKTVCPLLSGWAWCFHSTVTAVAWMRGQDDFLAFEP